MMEQHLNCTTCLYVCHLSPIIIPSHITPPAFVRGKFAALEDLSCKIKPGCTDHLPWPKGICSKCQPSAVTLNRQVSGRLGAVLLLV